MKTECSWCLAERGQTWEKVDPDVTHTICDRHLEELYPEVSDSEETISAACEFALLAIFGAAIALVALAVFLGR
jgi:hypothetical protein